MTVDLLIRNARLQGRTVDIAVANGEIVDVFDAGSGPEAAEIFDANGLMAMASLTDVHTHLREPGYEYKEDIASGLKAAAHGGFANIMCMANTKPVNDNATVTELMLEKAAKSWPRGPRLYPIGALTKGLSGKELSPMAELKESGCVAVSNDGVPIKSTELMRRAMEYASDWGLTVIDHCEDPYMAVAAGMNEGEVSSRMGIPAQPDAAEAIQVARDVLLAEYLELPVHLAHVSCKQSVDLIAWAKERGVRVTAETCPHYLIMDESAAGQYDTNAKVNPPLRTPEDVAAMLDALETGVVDCLATDHAPHAAHEKEVEFDFAPCGISGLDTALSTTWALVTGGKLSEKAFIRAWTTAPCAIFGLPVNTFQPGDSADFLLFDPEAEWTVEPAALYSKGKNTPLSGQALKGRVIHHFLRGEKIV